MAFDPLHQFEIHEVYPVELLGYQVPVTNQTVWMFMASIATLLFLWSGIRRKEMVPGRFQAFVEMTFEMVYNMVKDNAGREGLKYLPFVLTIFFFIAFINLLGMVPGSYTPTSQIFMTASMALMVFALVLIIGFFKHGMRFFSLFWPPDTPWYMGILIAPLEVISFIARPFTLCVRLTANMLAGHILVKVFASFVIMLLGFGALVGPVAGSMPFLALIAISALEFLVAVLQAYVFAILTAIYLNDALHLH